MSIDKIILGVAAIFPKVEFDIDLEIQGDKSEIYKIWVSDFDFYFNNKMFKKITNQYRVKYPNIRHYYYYQNRK
jgi:hypothetical protein